MHSNQSNPVAITGALGKVGQKVVPFLKDKHSLRLLDLRTGNLADLPVHKADILDLDDLLQTCSGASAIVHFAIADYSGVPDKQENPLYADYRSRMLDVNIRGTYNVFEAARQLKIPRVIYISSMTTSLGDDPAARFTPDRAPRPCNFYGCTKLFGEYVAENYHKEYGIASYCLRLGQPWPSPNIDMEAWSRRPQSASLLASFHDIARAVDAALTTDNVHFGIYNVVSVNSYQRVDFSKGEEIGFFPQDCTDFKK